MAPHSKIGTRLNSTVAPYVKRVYQKLSSKDLLDSCKEMGTQNTNECLHNTVWSLCSKVIYTFIYNIYIYII